MLQSLDPTSMHCVCRWCGVGYSELRKHIGRQTNRQAPTTCLLRCNTFTGMNREGRIAPYPVAITHQVHPALQAILRCVSERYRGNASDWLTVKARLAKSTFSSFDCKEGWKKAILLACALSGPPYAVKDCFAARSAFLHIQAAYARCQLLLAHELK